jgi:NADP-dependent aldehyde dehydrogenase
VQFFCHCDHADGTTLIGTEGVSAVAFTGSRKAGLHIKAAADSAGKPVYLEMSSVNPVFFLPGAVSERCEDIATEWATSLTLGGGQFCTKPGIGFAIGKDADAIAEAVTARCVDSPDGVLFTSSLVEEMADGIAAMQDAGATLLCGGTQSGSWGFTWPATLLRVDGETFEENFDVLGKEAFGPTGLLIELRDLDQAVRIAKRIEGQLTVSLYSNPDDADAFKTLAAPLRHRCGRLLQNKMPTGVAVVPSMVHGGPFPATGHPGFTAVGMPTSVSRFAARQCFDGIEEEFLPEILR